MLDYILFSSVICIFFHKICHSDIGGTSQVARQSVMLVILSLRHKLLI
jgi:hypothetical protein